MRAHATSTLAALALLTGGASGSSLPDAPASKPAAQAGSKPEAGRRWGGLLQRVRRREPPLAYQVGPTYYGLPPEEMREGGKPYLVQFKGRGDDYCEQMEPLKKQLQQELGAAASRIRAACRRARRAARGVPPARTRSRPAARARRHHDPLLRGVVRLAQPRAHDSHRPRPLRRRPLLL